MSFLNKIFKSKEPFVSPDISFGRFSDATKTDEHYASWDKAVQAFESQKHLASYIHFFDFLRNEANNNIDCELHQGVLNFALMQGSIKIEGYANFQKFTAVARIVYSETSNLALYRYLLENNFHLKYTKYGLDSDGHILLIFDTFVEDSSPHKLYEALKELATEADRKDDVLINKFKSTKPIERTHITRVDQHQAHVKYAFLRQQIKNTLQNLTESIIDLQKYPGAEAFILLDTIYQIDYLVKPEGIIKEKIALCHEYYFDNSSADVFDKNRFIKARLKEISQLTESQVAHELYDVSYTFGNVKPEAGQIVSSIIDAQAKDIQWYMTNHPDPYVSAITGYIIGLSLYSYALPTQIKELLQLYYRVVHDAYFGSLGFSPSYSLPHGGAYISLEIKNILQQGDPNKDVKQALQIINYTDYNHFGLSLLTLIDYEAKLNQ